MSLCLPVATQATCRHHLQVLLVLGAHRLHRHGSMLLYDTEVAGPTRTYAEAEIWLKIIFLGVSIALTRLRLVCFTVELLVVRRVNEKALLRSWLLMIYLCFHKTIFSQFCLSSSVSFDISQAFLVENLLFLHYIILIFKIFRLDEVVGLDCCWRLILGLFIEHASLVTRLKLHDMGWLCVVLLLLLLWFKQIWCSSLSSYCGRFTSIDRRDNWPMLVVLGEQVAWFVNLNNLSVFAVHSTIQYDTASWVCRLLSEILSQLYVIGLRWWNIWSREIPTRVLWVSRYNCSRLRTHSSLLIVATHPCHYKINLWVKRISRCCTLTQRFSILAGYLDATGLGW